MTNTVREEGMMVTGDASSAVLNGKGDYAREERKPLTATVSLSQKIGLPGYGNAECFLSLSNVTKDTTEAEIDVMLDQAGLSWKKIAGRIRDKVSEIKAESGI